MRRRMFVSMMPLLGVSCGIFLLLFSWQWRVGTTRFFDVDEFTYFHWVTQFSRGDLPYIDFFMFFPPVFLFFFAPVFFFFQHSVQVFIAARVVSIIIAFFLFLGCGILLALVRRNLSILFLPAIIAAFLPMPFDKFIEIRPDNVATLFGLYAVIAHVSYYLGIRKKFSATLSGLLYAGALLTFPKMIVFVLPAVGVVGIEAVLTYPKRGMRGVIDIFSSFLLGGAGISFVVGVYLLLLGNIGTVLYSLTTLAIETNKVYRFVMEPHLFFFPNIAFYGGSGITPGLFFNHLFWMIGICFSAFRLFTTVFSTETKKGSIYSEILLTSIFFFGVWLYISFYPMKHPQYLVPIALFVAVYTGDLIGVVVLKVQRYLVVGPVLLVLALGIVLYPVSAGVNEPKLGGSNTVQLRQLQQLQAMIPSQLEVFDIEGRMIFWDQPYPICCLPFGEYMHQITRKPRPLRVVLEEKKVPLLWQGESRRIYTLEMPDREYIQAMYEEVEGWGDALWIRKEFKK